MLLKKSVLMTLLVSFALAWVSYSYVKKNNKMKIVTNKPGFTKSRYVLASVKDIPERKVLSQDMFIKTPIPARLYNKNMVTNLDTDTFFARSSIDKGEILYYSKLGKIISEPELSYMIDREQGCITVKVNQISGVGGILKPGDIVDVYVTYFKEQLENLPMKDKPKSITKRIVSGARVVANDKEVLPPVVTQESGPEKFNKLRKPEPVSMITLAAADYEIEKILYATSNGKIQLVLKSNADAVTYQLPGYSTSTLHNEIFRKKTHTIETIRNDKLEIVNVD